MARSTWEIVVQHPELHKLRVIRGSDKKIVEQKAYLQRIAWEEQWRKQESRRLNRENAILEKEARIQSALDRTEEARAAIAQIENTLSYTLEVDDRIDWEQLKDKSQFDRPRPQFLLKKPNPSHPIYYPNLNFFDIIFSSRKQRKISEAEQSFLSDLECWKEERHLHEIELRKWEEDKSKFFEEQKNRNLEVEKRKADYLNSNPAAIIDYCEMVLSNSHYPDNFPQEFDLDYDPQTKILIVDYALPHPGLLPKLKEVKYIQSNDEFSQVFLSYLDIEKMYDDLLYQITLRTIHELYEADAVNVLESIVFNGWVNAVDKSTGNETNACVMSVQASKTEFASINLSQVDAKECFRKLKGVGSSKLHGLSPVAPILKINKDDKRFVASIDVLENIDDSVNLAAMDWLEFEHLVRQLFEKEFAQEGEEVKITRASRDGGVDAIVFNNDPLRGGKIVIQAKRYTNIVGVSAVRDLFGTVLHEGAIKGILVTTSKFGPDAYEFIKGKPLTLLEGSELLYLLQKHHVKAKIDLREAKKTLSEKQVS